MTPAARSRRFSLRRRLAELGAADRAGADRGSVVIEYTIVVTAVLAVIFLSIQVALYSYARSVALTAAEEGANAQRAYGASTSAGSAAAHKVVSAQGDTLRLGRNGIRVTTVGGEVRVVVTGKSQSVIAGFGGFTVTQTATGPVERFQR